VLLLLWVGDLGAIRWVPEGVLVRCAELLQDTVVEEVIEHVPEENESVLELVWVPVVDDVDVLVVDSDHELFDALEELLCQGELDLLRKGHGDVVSLVNLGTKLRHDLLSLYLLELLRILADLRGLLGMGLGSNCWGRLCFSGSRSLDLGVGLGCFGLSDGLLGWLLGFSCTLFCISGGGGLRLSIGCRSGGLIGGFYCIRLGSSRFLHSRYRLSGLSNLSDWDCLCGLGSLGGLDRWE